MILTNKTFLAVKTPCFLFFLLLKHGWKRYIEYEWCSFQRETINEYKYWVFVIELCKILSNFLQSKDHITKTRQEKPNFENWSGLFKSYRSHAVDHDHFGGRMTISKVSHIWCSTYQIFILWSETEAK